jgi:hypothetical protein
MRDQVLPIGDIIEHSDANIEIKDGPGPVENPTE